VGIREERASKLRVVGIALGCGPTVIRAGNAIVDLFKRALPNIVDEHSSGAGLKRECKGIAQPKGPNRAVISGRLTIIRVAGGYRAIAINAKHFA
jgi:hypothetical protein